MIIIDFYKGYACCKEKGEGERKEQEPTWGTFFSIFILSKRKESL